jgi:hypothetical protein
MAMSFTGWSVGGIAVAALAVGWMGSSVINNSAAQQSRAPFQVRALGSSTPVVPRAERLREHRAQAPLPTRGRNPFVYGPRIAPRPESYRDRAPATAMPAPAPIPEAPALPVFRLSGVASEAKDGVIVLTAIIIDNASMVFAKTGDKLSNGYSVVKVEETSVTLIDATGVTQTIRLP